MKSLLHTALSLFLGHTLSAQESINLAVPEETKYTPSEKTIFYRLADKEIPLKVQQYGNRSDIVFINLHDDESTSVEAAKTILKSEGGLLIEVENDLKRVISFRLGRYTYAVDPNRIFTRKGIEKSLSELRRSSVRAVEKVEKFGQRIIQLIPEDASCVIALHNNTPGLFSAIDYSPRNSRAKEAAKVYINSLQDEDDFFLTTSGALYKELSDKGFNTVLQDNKNCTDDGSLSVYCGKRNIRYVNCETEHGKTEQYSEMIKTLVTILQK